MYSKIAGTGCCSASSGSQSRPASFVPSDMGIQMVSRWRIFFGGTGDMQTPERRRILGGGFENGVEGGGVDRNRIHAGADIHGGKRGHGGELALRQAEGRHRLGNGEPPAQIQDPLPHGGEGLALEVKG